MNALLRPKGLQLRHLWRKAQQKLSFVETERMNVYTLQVMSILRQAYCSPKYLYYLLPGQAKKVRDADGSLRDEVLISDTKEFERRWHEAVESLRRAIDLLRHPQEFGAISSRYLPYVAILPVFSAAWTWLQTLPDNRQLDAQRKIRLWYWASVFTSRYSGSVESTSARDFLDLRTWFKDDAAEPAVVAGLEDQFRTLDLRGETKHGTSVYNGIFNLLVLHGARDWITGTVPEYDKLDDHHIVPKRWGKEQRLGKAIDTILNRTPLASSTNRNFVRDRMPSEYISELIEENGEPLVRDILESHFISPAAFEILHRDPFTPSDYEEFLAERQRTLQEAVEDLLLKRRLDTPLRLEELSARIEAVELALRKLIVDALEDDITKLPSHVAQKVDQRVRAALRKHPAFNSDRYKTLDTRLEYADLREIEATVTSKSLTPLFRFHFPNKEMVVKRFDQLAELRNAIRHSRTADEITRADGQAAILWFEQMLSI